jgi:hypothetical protein
MSGFKKHIEGVSDATLDSLWKETRDRLSKALQGTPEHKALHEQMLDICIEDDFRACNPI